jgi:hypothetical protein
MQDIVTVRRIEWVFDIDYLVENVLGIKLTKIHLFILAVPIRDV